MKSMKERKIYLKKKETNFTFIYVFLNAILIYQKLFMTKIQSIVMPNVYIIITKF